MVLSLFLFQQSELGWDKVKMSAMNCNKIILFFGYPTLTALSTLFLFCKILILFNKPTKVIYCPELCLNKTLLEMAKVQVQMFSGRFFCLLNSFCFSGNILCLSVQLIVTSLLSLLVFCHYRLDECIFFAHSYEKWKHS